MGDYAAAAPAIVGLFFGIIALIAAHLTVRRYKAERRAAGKSEELR